MTVKKAQITVVYIYLDERVSVWPSASITVQKNGFWTGTIAFEDKETVDERLILEDALWWKDKLFPLRSTPKGHEVGVIHEITRQPYGAIRANGTCEISPGDYACGIDIDAKDKDVEYGE